MAASVVVLLTSAAATAQEHPIANYASLRFDRDGHLVVKGRRDVPIMGGILGAE